MTHDTKDAVKDAVRHIRFPVSLDERLLAVLPPEFHGSRKTETRVHYAVREWLDGLERAAQQRDDPRPAA